jgi:hypothetical protein
VDVLSNVAWQAEARQQNEKAALQEELSRLSEAGGATSTGPVAVVGGFEVCLAVCVCVCVCGVCVFVCLAVLHLNAQ